MINLPECPIEVFLDVVQTVRVELFVMLADEGKRDDGRADWNMNSDLRVNERINRVL